MYHLPTQMIHEADQSKAQADQVTANMVRAVRHDLAEYDVDPIYIFWTLAHSLSQEPSWLLASALASTLVRLGVQEQGER